VVGRKLAGEGLEDGNPGDPACGRAQAGFR